MGNSSSSECDDIRLGVLNMLHTPYYEECCKGKVYTDEERMQDPQLKVKLRLMSVLAIQECPVVGKLRTYLMETLPNHKFVCLFKGNAGPALAFDTNMWEQTDSGQFYSLSKDSDTYGYTMTSLKNKSNSVALTVVSCHVTYSLDKKEYKESLSTMVRKVETAGDGGPIFIAGDFNLDHCGSRAAEVLSEVFSSSQWEDLLGPLPFTHRCPTDDRATKAYIMHKRGRGPLLKFSKAQQYPERFECLIPHAAGETAANPVFISDSALCWVDIQKFEMHGALDRDDECTLGKIIGAGGFGKVYVMTRRKDGMVYAAKEISKGEGSLGKEVEILKSLQHPNIIHCYGTHKVNGTIYLVMEMADYDLDHEMELQRKKREAFPLVRVEEIMKDIAAGVAFVHSRGFIHRDLKPNNLLFAGGRYKLADFGITKMNTIEEIDNQSHCGTLSYFAPEMLRKQWYNEKTDIWSMGCIFYEVLMLKHPFFSDSVSSDDGEKHARHGKYKKLPDNILPRYRKLVYDMLEVNPEKRPTAEEILERLGRR